MNRFTEADGPVAVPSNTTKLQSGLESHSAIIIRVFGSFLPAKYHFT